MEKFEDKELKFNEEETELIERAVDIYSGLISQSISKADERIKGIMSCKESIEKTRGKKHFDELLGNGIKDWDECMTYFYVLRAMSDKLKRIRWLNKGLQVSQSKEVDSK